MSEYVEMLEEGTLYEYIINLEKQLEAYENMKKELKNYIKNCIGIECKEDLLNILNKVGGSDE